MSDNKKQPARKIEDLTKIQCCISKCGCKLWNSLKKLCNMLFSYGQKQAVADINKRVHPSTSTVEDATAPAAAKKPATKKTSTTTKKAPLKSTNKPKAAKKTAATKKKAMSKNTTSKE